MEDDLDPCELVWVVAKEVEAMVDIQMFTQQFHDCLNYHFYDIDLFDQLSGLEEEREREVGDGCTDISSLVFLKKHN